jgi:amino acid transporter
VRDKFYDFRALTDVTSPPAVGVTVGECQNPRKNVPLAIKRTFWRILIFYIGSVFVVGLIVPANDPRLLDATKASTSAAASPFVVAITIAGSESTAERLGDSVLGRD